MIYGKDRAYTRDKRLTVTPGNEVQDSAIRSTFTCPSLSLPAVSFILDGCIDQTLGSLTILDAFVNLYQIFPSFGVNLGEIRLALNSCGPNS